MDSRTSLGEQLSRSAALVAFSGGQDSATALAWALRNYDRVETVGFRYGQKHYIEIGCRPVLREALASIDPTWKEKLGPDHLIELDLVGQIAGVGISSPDGYSLVTGEGFEAGSRYIPGRNLIMLSLSASVAFRRDIRTLVCGVSETEYSGYPDCRDASMRAIELALNAASGMKFAIEAPLMWLSKSEVWQLAEGLGGSNLVEVIREHTHSCYLGSRDTQHEWGYGCGGCAACKLREKGWREFSATPAR